MIVNRAQTRKWPRKFHFHAFSRQVSKIDRNDDIS